MIFIYAILLPRYARLFPPLVAFLAGAVSYPLMHIFESWTRYDSLYHAAVSIIFVLLTFFPAGLMKSFLTFRTGNAWVHMWAFHAITPSPPQQTTRTPAPMASTQTSVLLPPDLRG